MNILKKTKSSALTFIFISMTLDIVGFGLIIPVIPSLISEVKHVNIQQSSIWGGYLMFAYALMQFLFSPMLGNLSDRYGRRRIILLSLLGFVVEYIIMALAGSYALLMIGRLLTGITGGSYAAANSYIADVSTDENRAKNFGLIGAAFGLGFIIGPALGGLLSHWGIRTPFWVAAGISLLNFIYGYFILPESLKPENRRAFSWKKANPIGTFYYFKKHYVISSLILGFFFIYLAQHAINSTWTFYTMFKFSWSEKEVGLSLAFAGIIVGLVQGGLIRVVNPILGDKKSVYLGLLFFIIGLVLFAFASKGWMMYLFTIPYCLGGLGGPALQSIIAKHIPKNEQGQMQGGLASLMSLASIFGPLLMTNLFFFGSRKSTQIDLPGLPFLASALFIIISLILTYQFGRKNKLPNTNL